MTDATEPTGIGRLLALPRKIRKQGMSWAWQRVGREFLVPTTGWTRWLASARVRLEHYGLRSRGGATKADADTLYYFLDLEVCPITYDVVSYLAGADMHRRDLGLSKLHVVVVPGTVQGVRAETAQYEAAIDIEARKWRLHNLVVPLFHLLPSCAGYTMYGSREEALKGLYAHAQHIFPVGYSVNVPNMPLKRLPVEAARAGKKVMPMFRATPKALAYMRDFLEPRAKGRRVVVLNLRNSPSYPVRNSTDANWFAFAHELDRTNWLPVFMMDTNVAMRPPPPELDGFLVCETAPWNSELRLALYELADLTMSIGQGPMELCWLDDHVRYVMFVRRNSSPQATDEYHRFTGFEVDQNPPYAVPGQRWVWLNDDLPVIRQAFHEMTGD